MSKLDALSQQPDHGPGLDNMDMTLLSPNLLQVHMLEGVVVTGPEVPLLCDIYEALTSELDLKNLVVLTAWELLKVWGARSSWSAEWHVNTGLL